MFYTAATVAIGFLVLILSNFIPSIYFGIFMALAMLSAVLVNLTLLPKLLIFFKPEMNSQRLIK
jgi:predicted RND superfamily exporter protein